MQLHGFLCVLIKRKRKMLELDRNQSQLSTRQQEKDYLGIPKCLSVYETFLALLIPINGLNNL